MDGLLIDSEDIYTMCNNVILHQYGKPSLPWNIKAQLQGRPGPEAGEIFHAWAQLPLSRSEFLSKQTALQRKHFPSAQPLPGVLSLLNTLTKEKVHIALATSSHAINFALKSSHLDSLFSYFPARNRVLGDDPRIPPGKGKPAPDIYLLALETINAEIRAKGVEREIALEECLVFEDSVPGIEAGRRAGMRVIWCPHPELLKEYAGREREVLAGMTNKSVKQDETVREALEEAGAEGRVKGRVGRLDDGWGEMLKTLIGFPYARYGIGG